MNQDSITHAEREAIKKYWGKSLESLHPDEFQKTRKHLRAKYHPDNFEKFEDETVREMATERFQNIEALAKKLEAYFAGTLRPKKLEDQAFHPKAQFAFDQMKIEVITSDKDLKYHLFGTSYRWLINGDRYKIPNTKDAYIIIDDDHRGMSIGFREAIRMYVTFGIDDAVEDIVDWLYERIKERATSLLIQGETIPVDRNEMMRKIKKTSFLQIGAGE